MIKEIEHNTVILSQKSIEATIMDLPIADDLRDTLNAHFDECVGMAANMIGVLKRIIIFNNNGKLQVMFNPEIIKCRNPYETQEGCLSLTGIRPTTRYKNIRVKYQDENFQEQVFNYCNFTAQIIQHEIDHLDGILI